MSYRVVIPARYGSTRLPGKPLVDLLGKPMIVRVAEQALRSGAKSVVVATDDERVVEAVRGSGATAMLTRNDHRSGSDRVMEVVETLGWSDAEIVVNVQGDEPLVPSAVIDQVAGLIDDACGVATLCEPIVAPDDVFDPNIVKVVADQRGRALYFSRAPIPWARDTFGSGTPSHIDNDFKRHIGIYAYRAGRLKALSAAPPSPLEREERLEQLRALELGYRIAVADAVDTPPRGVDTQEDLEAIRAIVKSRST